MRRLTSLVAVLLLVLTAAPVMACLTGEPMSQMQSACCRAMQGRCGEMARTQDCCQSEAGDHHSPAQMTASTRVHAPEWVALTHADLLLALPEPSGLAVWLESGAESPPESPFTKLTVLRI